MKSIILLALIVLSVYGRNPGAMIGLREPVLNKIKDQYFDLIMLGMQFIFVEDINEGTVTMTNIQPVLKIASSSQVQIGFDEPRNLLVVTVVNAGLKVHLNWRESSTGKTGNGDLDGTIANITMFMSFGTESRNSTYIPKINFESVVINENVSDFTIVHGCNECDANTISRIENAMGAQLFNHFENDAKKIVNTLITPMVNVQLQTLYPESFPITSDISIMVGHTDKIMVKETFITVPIDATIYNPNVAFERCMDAPDFSIQNASNPGEMLLFASDYVYACMAKVVNRYDFNFTFNVFGTNVTINIDDAIVPFELESEVGHMRMLAGGNITVPVWNVGMKFALETKLDIDISPGNSAAMFSLVPKLVDADFRTLIVNIWGFQLDLKNSIVPYVNRMMESILNLIFFPRIVVPKIDTVPIKLNKANLEFFANHTEAGLTVSFT